MRGYLKLWSTNLVCLQQKAYYTYVSFYKHLINKCLWWHTTFSVCMNFHYNENVWALHTTTFTLYPASYCLCTMLSAICHPYSDNKLFLWVFSQKYLALHSNFRHLLIHHFVCVCLCACMRARACVLVLCHCNGMKLNSLKNRWHHQFLNVTCRRESSKWLTNNHFLHWLYLHFFFPRCCSWYSMKASINPPYFTDYKYCMPK